MNPDYLKLPSESLIQHLQELEHSYAEVFAAEISTVALNDLLQQIRSVKREIERRKIYQYKFNWQT